MKQILDKMAGSCLMMNGTGTVILAVGWGSLEGMHRIGHAVLTNYCIAELNIKVSACWTIDMEEMYYLLFRLLLRLNLSSDIVKCNSK